VRKERSTAYGSPWAHPLPASSSPLAPNSGFPNKVENRSYALVTSGPRFFAGLPAKGVEGQDKRRRTLARAKYLR
jgi:hypothetical protein